jgi:hypothetical protein
VTSPSIGGDSPEDHVSIGAGARTSADVAATPPPSRWYLLSIAATAVVGAVIALLVAGFVRAPIGPFDTTLSARPALHGDTVVHLAPLGTLNIDTHDAPLTLEIGIDELRPQAAERIARNPAALQGVEDSLAADSRMALWSLARKALFVAVVGGILGALARSARLRAGFVGAVIGAVAAAAVLAMTLATWRPQALAEPR